MKIDPQHKVLATTAQIIMGLQAHPCGNKRPFEELEEPAAVNGRTQEQPQEQNHNHHHYLQPLEDCSARSAKQQCTIRVGLEAPAVVTASVLSSTPSCNDSSETIPEMNNSVTWYRDVQHQQSQTPDYDAYVNGFNAAEARASTPFTSSTSIYYSASSSATNNSESGLVPVPEYSHPLLPTFSGGNGAGCPNEAYSSVNIYQNLSSMQPVVLSGESLADRFERVCSSPRPYVQQYSANGRDADGYNYGSESTKTTDERYWTFGYSSHCPKKATTSTTSTTGGGGGGSGGNYAKCSYGYDSGFAGNKSGVVVCQQTENGQKIQRDENGKSYLELGANAVAAVQPEWRPMWPTSGNNTCHSNQQLHQNSVPYVKSCTKCGNILTNGGQQLQKPCYKHQRLSVLSLSMHKLNRYRQCSDPSLHRSVLICNTLRCIEDEMEREGLTGNATTTAETLPTTTTTNLNGVVSNCDTCCCSHCGTVLTSSSNPSASEAPPQAHQNYTNVNNMPPSSYESHLPSTDPNFATCTNSNTPVSNTSTASTATMTPINNNNNNNTSSSSEMDTSKTSSAVSNADEDDSGFGDEDSRDIDWSSVFSMSTTTGFDVSSSSINLASAAAHSTPESYSMCDSIASTVDPSLFPSSASGLQSESPSSPHWKNSSCNNASWTTSDAGDFSTFRWKNEMGDELDPGFVTHIMVGS